MITALLVIVASVTIGTLAHELSHAVALRTFSIPHSLAVFPDRGASGSLRMGLRGRWAMVTYHDVPADLAPWKLRLASLMPLSLAVPPIILVLTVPGMTAIDGNLYLTLAALGWLACAIPSPADFAIFWHPREAMRKASRS